MKYRVIDLFSGAGGLTCGFVDPGFCGEFTSVLAIDNDPDAVLTHKANFGPHALCVDIEKWLSETRSLPLADIVIGGPPCQGFSLLNKNREGDRRRGLWEPYMDVVERSAASLFLIENVEGLYKSPELVAIRSRAKALGFDTAATILNAADYGAPQTRRRTIVLGWRTGLDEAPLLFPPPQTHFPPDDSRQPKWRTVRDAIEDLGRPVGTEIRSCQPPDNLHFGRSPTDISLRRYQCVPEGGNRFDLQRNAPDITPQCWIRKTSGGTDLFGRLWWDRPSVTIRTEFFKPEKGRYLHPTQHRPITHREAARLMGFPDRFEFRGRKISIARQIGNAVCPPLAGALARMCAELLQRRDQAAA
ncbi:DNA cytosine methyltransferase [Thioalkalivibrio sp. XN279]|uniref:DNA cytosine methyltransferase n=1 Tax=Thioalkalivibrio sp. XN279 TaxID=2714953 RepID=UPI001981E272